MAAIARGEGAPEAEVRGWLARAVDAPRGDALDSELSHAAMLPLLIGGDDETEDAETVEEAEDAAQTAEDAAREEEEAEAGPSAAPSPPEAQEQPRSNAA